DQCIPMQKIQKWRLVKRTPLRCMPRSEGTAVLLESVLLPALPCLGRPSEPRLRLLADDVYEITHRDVDIHKMQAPVRQHLTVPNDIADDVVGARTGWIAVHRHLEIG